MASSKHQALSSKALTVISSCCKCFDFFSGGDQNRAKTKSPSEVNQACTVQYVTLPLRNVIVARVVHDCHRKSKCSGFYGLSNIFCLQKQHIVCNVQKLLSDIN